ncbi:MAG: PQQ-binding-like beta-propeller repeat protein, partial [Roseiflexaceae bacterium]
FLRLVTLGEGVEDTRRRVRRTELATMTKDTQHPTTDDQLPATRASLELDHVIATYGQYRLLTLDNDPATRLPTVEVAHEALIRTWTRLRQWLDASRDDLRLQRRMTTAAAEWVASGHERSFLASGARLEQLAAWADETHLALNAEEREYLSASLAERAAQQAQEAIRKRHEATLERRSRTFLQALVGVALLAAVVGIGLSIFAFGQRQIAVDNEKLALQSADVAATAQAQAQSEAERAKQQEAIAKQQETLANTSFNEARDRALASGSQAAFTQGNLDLALPLAMTIADKPDPQPFAEKALVDVVQSPGTRQVYPIPGTAAQGHKGIINTVAFSPDGTRAVSGGRDDHILILWDLDTGNELQRFVGHTLDVRQAVFLPDGKQILSASTDGTLILWDIATGKALRTFKQHKDEVKGVALRPNGTQFMSVGLDTRVLLWNINCSQPTQSECDTPIREFKGHTQEVNQVAFTSDGKRAITASQDGILFLWDVEAGQLIRQIEPQEGRNELRGIAFLPDDRHVLAGGASGDMTEWDTETGQPVRVFKGHNRTLYDIAVSKDGKRALSGSTDNTVILWDVQNGSIIHQFHGHGGYIREVAFNPQNESQAISCSADGTLRLWYLDSPVERRRLDGPGQIHAGSFSSDGRSVVTGAEKKDSGVGELQLWDATTGELRFDKSYQGRGVKAVAFSPDGTTILAGGDKHDGSLTLVDAKTGQFIRTFTAKTFGVNALAFTPDGKRALSGSIIPPAEEVKANPALTNTMLMLWDVATGAPIRQFQGLTDSANGLVFLPGGTQVLVATGPNLGIWDIETGQRVLDFKKRHKSNINALALSTDGKVAVSGARDKFFIVWDVATGAQLWTSEAQDSEISGIAISKDGRYVLTAVQKDVLMWDVKTQQKVRQFLGHREIVNDVAFSPDERLIVSASADGTARIWQLDPLVDMVAWAKKNLYIPALSCDQKQTYKLDSTNCT